MVTAPCFLAADATNASRETPLTEVLSARTLLDAQGRILEQMASGTALSTVAEGIALLVEEMVPSASCAIVVVRPDGQHLKTLAAPHLPPDYFAAIDGLKIGPDCGLCGTAAWRRQPVIITDTATDPLWHKLQKFAGSSSVRAGWALPILHQDGSVLGVLSLYYRQPAAPSDWDWSVLASCIKLIRLALAANRREQRLRASDERWRIGAEALGLGTFEVDFETGIDKWSPALRQILGVAEQTPASFGSFLDLVHPDDRKALAARISEVPQVPGARWRQELRLRRADTGEERIIVTEGCLIADDDGRLLHAVGALSDVTERRRYEQELETAKAAAEAASRAKSKFLASMSHELRTPLNAIIGFSDMIKSRVFGAITPERYQSYIDDIHKSGIHLLSLINDVLDMAKIEAQKFELHRTAFPLKRLADGALLLVRPQADAKALRLACDIPRDVILTADERALCQVLVNLLSNAVKFTRSGGVVRLFAERRCDGGLDLGVEDTGTGMSVEGIATALEPFGQAHMDVTTERSGTGLGLPLAKAMIESHGAAFRITSQPGVGTRIWGEFPADAVSVALRNAS